MTKFSGMGRFARGAPLLNFISYKSKMSTITVRFEIRPHRLSSIIQLLLTLSFYISLISIAIIQVHLRGLRIQLILRTLHPGQTSLPSIMWLVNVWILSQIYNFKEKMHMHCTLS